MAESNPRHQVIRTMLAGLDDKQLTTLRASLEQSRALIDARLAALEAEREQLVLRRDQLAALVDRLGNSKGFEELRGALLKGERLGDKLARPKVPAAAATGKPKRPARRTTRGGTGSGTRGGTTPRP